MLGYSVCFECIDRDALKHNSSPGPYQSDGDLFIFIFPTVREFMHNIQQISILISNISREMYPINNGTL